MEGSIIDCATPVQLTPSRCRWNMLRDVILNKKLEVKKSHSVRSFSSFKLFSCKQNSDASNSQMDPKTVDGQWLSCSCKDMIQSRQVWIQRPNANMNLQDLVSFNNTGNVCIWPSEEVLAYYCTLHCSEFTGKSVVELGGGSTCLAGLCIAVNSTSPGKVLLTDGNAKCVESIQATINMNSKKLIDVNISADHIRWDDEYTYKNYLMQFDHVICADCLFFDETRQSLAKAIHKLLKPNGVAWIFAPKRGKTLTQFVDVCKEMFASVTECEQYCDHITNCHKRELKENRLYKPNIHFPIMLTLHKS